MNPEKRSITLPLRLKRMVASLILIACLLSNSGCAWMADMLIDNLVNKSETERGLRSKNSKADWQNKQIRRWDTERRYDEMKQQSERDQAWQEQDAADRDWNEHISRDRSNDSYQ